jgi:hypothetical protein
MPRLGLDSGQTFTLRTLTALVSEGRRKHQWVDPAEPVKRHTSCQPCWKITTGIIFRAARGFARSLTDLHLLLETAMRYEKNYNLPVVHLREF